MPTLRQPNIDEDNYDDEYDDVIEEDSTPINNTTVTPILRTTTQIITIRVSKRHWYNHLLH